MHPPLYFSEVKMQADKTYYRRLYSFRPGKSIRPEFLFTYTFPDSCGKIMIVKKLNSGVLWRIFKALNRLLEEVLEQGPADCGSAVARDGKILFEEYHGVKDLEGGEPITADSVYRQYFTTKVAVCTGAMMLLERGKIL